MKTYTDPSMDITKFDVQDIVTSNEFEGNPSSEIEG